MVLLTRGKSCLAQLFLGGGKKKDLHSHARDHYLKKMTKASILPGLSRKNQQKKKRADQAGDLCLKAGKRGRV